MNRLVRWLRFNLMYFGRPPWDTGISPPELIEFIHSHAPGRVIDLGCGTGTNLLTLGKAGWQVTGVDFAVRAVTRAREKLASAGIAGEVRAGDVTKLETVQGTYDLVLDIGCYHSLSEAGRQAYRENLGRILAPEGYFLIYAHLEVPVETAGPVGITQADVDAFQAQLTLENRQDSQDRWGRSATWLGFQA